MFRAQGSIIVHRPVEEVFALLPYAATDNMQGSSLSKLMAIADQLKERNPSSTYTFPIKTHTPDGKIEKGSIFQIQVQTTTSEGIITYKVIEIEPDRKLTLEYTEDRLVGVSIICYELESVTVGTRLTMTREIEKQGCYPLFLRLINATPGMKGISASMHLRSLKHMLEQGKLLEPGHRASGPLPALDEGQLPTEAPE